MAHQCLQLIRENPSPHAADAIAEALLPVAAGLLAVRRAIDAFSDATDQAVATHGLPEEFREPVTRAQDALRRVLRIGDADT